MHTHIKTSILSFRVLCLVLLLGSVSIHPPLVYASSATLTVTTLADDSTDGICTAEHCTLREATDAANPGDTVVFASGLTGTITLTNQLRIDKSLTITGPGAEKLTISGTGTIQIFAFNGSGADMYVSNMTLANGSGEGGGAIYGNSANITVDHVTFTANTAGFGGAIGQDLSGGILTVTNSKFIGNTSSQGAAIGVAGGSVVITNTQFLGNESFGQGNGQGAALFYSANGSVIVTGSSFEGNSSSDGGGAIYNSSGNAVTLNTSTFRSNMVTNGPGGAVYSTGDVVGTGSLFINNYSSNGGGAITTSGASLNLANTDFTNNSSIGTHGGAIELDSGSDGRDSVISGGTFEGNYSNNYYGGAVYATGNQAIAISGTTFKNNQSYGSGGALFLNSNSSITGSHFIGNKTLSDGGAIRYAGGTTHTIASSTFSDNSSLYNGGAIVHNSGTLTISDNSVFTGNTADMDNDGDMGGAIFSSGSALTVDHTTFSNNKAANGSQGGAVYLGTSGSFTADTFSNNMAGLGGGAIFIGGGTVSIASSTFNQNISDNNAGGAIYHNGGDLTIQNTHFTENQANNGGIGGAIFAIGGTLSIDQVAFERNTAPGEAGGALFLVEKTTISNSSFVGNTAGNGWGGAIYTVTNQTLDITNTTFADNVASTTGGIYNDGTPVTLTNTTFAHDRSIVDGTELLNYSGTATVKNSIFAGSGVTNCIGTIISLGNNISSDDSCSLSDISDISSVDPKLDPEGPKILSSGPMLNGDYYLSVVALKPDSPALDHGDTCSLTDEVSGNRIGSACDIGAYEYNAGTVPSISNAQVFQTPTIVVTRLDDPVGGTCTSNTDCSLRQAVALSTTGDIIGFSPSLSGTALLASAITIDHPVTISGPGEKLLTLSGGGASQIFTVNTGGSLSLDHLTVADGYNFTGNAGAILTNDGAVNTSYVTFLANMAPNGEGGAIYAECGIVGRAITFDHTSFYGNSAQQGGAVYVCGETSGLNTLTVTHGIFKDNYASVASGGAIYSNNTSVTVSNSSLGANAAVSEGGAIYITSSPVEAVLSVSNSTFAANYALRGGAVSNGLSSPVHLSFTNNDTFLGNLSYNKGGAVYLVEGYLDALSNTTFQDNFSNWFFGGALYIQSPLNASPITMTDNTFIDNLAGSARGGAIYLDGGGSDFVINGETLFSGNMAIDSGRGGAIYANTNSLTINGAEFRNNTSWYGKGGALFVGIGTLAASGTTFTDNTAMNSTGGAIEFEGSGTATVTGSTFGENMSMYGNGGAIYQNQNAGLFVINGSTFTNNMVFNGNSGAVYGAGNGLSITNSSFFGNGAPDGAVGAIQHSVGDFTISGSTFAYNTASGYAGTIYENSADHVITLKNSTFYRNYAPINEGGGFYHDGSSLMTVNNTTFDENISNSLGGNAYVVYSASTTITNSIFAGSLFGSCADFGEGIDRINSTNNIDDGSGCFDAGANNQNNINSQSMFSNAGLADNGGTTLTLALAVTSPAIDTGSTTTCELTDQTGTTRTGHGVACDIGALELIPVADTTAPAAPTGFTATPSGSTINLSWTNPTDIDFASVTIRKSTEAYPVDISSGTLVAQGLTGTTTTDTNLANATYYYSIFAKDTTGNVSSKATTTAVVNVQAVVSNSSGGGYFLLPATSYFANVTTPPTAPPSVVSSAITPSAVSSSVPVFNIASLPTNFQFKKDLKPLSNLSDVKILQVFLNNNGFTVSQTGLGSKGKENDYLGLKTKKALIQFQEKYAKEILVPQGLKKGTGILGPYSRKVINSWLKQNAAR